MNNYGFTGKMLSKKLKKDTIRKGGFEIVDTPLLKCNLLDTDACVEIGGFPSIVNYNKDKEQEFKKNKIKKRDRSLRHQIKRFSCRNTYEDFPSYDLHLDKEGDHNS